MDLLPERWASNQIVFSKQQPRCEYKIHHRAESLRFLSDYSSPLQKEDLKFENEFWDHFEDSKTFLRMFGVIADLIK